MASGEKKTGVLVKGCIKALKRFPLLKLIIIGDSVKINNTFRHNKKLLSRVKIIHTDSIIGMNEKPARACFTKPKASIILAANEVKTGNAFGLYSPGNTGATVAASVLKIGLFKNVKKPVLASPLPTGKGHTFLLDSGANVEMNPELFLTFGILGRAFIKTIFSKKTCVSKLLNIGVEDTKGGPHIRKVYLLLSKKLPDFKGNIEGNDIFSGKSDIVLCDGFVGNIIIKLSEGFGKEIVKILSSRYSFIKERFSRTLSRNLKRIVNSENYGGAPLLGVKGIVLIGHGKARNRAVQNAVKNALFYKSMELTKGLEEALLKNT